MFKTFFGICFLILPLAVELSKINRLNKFNRENIRHLRFKEYDQPQFKAPQEQWYNQSLDHFDHTNKKTWKQVSCVLLISCVLKYFSEFMLPLKSVIFSTIRFTKQMDLFFYTSWENGMQAQMTLYVVQWLNMLRNSVLYACLSSTDFTENLGLQSTN